MTIEEELTLNNLRNRAHSMFVLGQLFGLTEEEIDHPNAGEWLVDCIKQVQTAALTYRAVAMRKKENQRIENYNPSPFIDKPNPLLALENAIESPSNSS